MKLFYNSDGTAKVLPVSSLPANTVWNGGFPYTPEGSLLVSIVSAKPTDTVSNGGFIQELWGGVCAGYDTPSIWIGGLAITSYGALCLDVDGGIVTDGPALYNSLTHTAVPARGSITPSFTRATTETGQKWDEAGYLDFTALAGEAVFKGARREYNQWTTSSVSLASGANKSLTLAAGTYQFSMGAGTGTATFSGTGGATGTLGASASVRVSVAKTITAGTLVVTASVADLADLQVCNITGETDQTTIRPYVSVGVGDIEVPLTNPNFDTDTAWTKEAGWTISGGTANFNGASPSNIYTGNGRVGVSVEITYTVSNYVSGTVRIRSGNSFGTGRTANGTYTETIATTVNAIFGLEAAAGSVATQLSIENISGRWLDHGSCVDGVKCFDTDRSGNPITTTTTYDAVTLNGVAGTYVSTPDSVSASITGDIDIRVKAAPVSWSGGYCYASKWDSSGTKSTFVFIGVAGKGLRLFHTADGSTVRTDTATAGVSFADGATGWIRVTRVAATGVVTFYESADGTTWTQVGAPVAGVAEALQDNNASVEIGSYSNGGAASLSGKIYSAQIYNGINGTLAVDFDASRYAGGTTLTGSTGETWTLQGNAVIHPTNYPLVGYVPWEARTNSLLHSRDLSNAAWVKVNCTGVKDAVGSGGVPNSASTLTATGANATILQTIVLAAAARSYSVKIKRKTGTGAVSICRDGVTFTDITAEINSSTYTTVKIENTSVLNPICGIKLATNGDAVYVDRNQDEAGAFSTPAIDTTTVAVARNADVDQYPTTAGPIAAAGSIALDFTPYHPPSGTIALWGTYVDASNYTAILHDATNLIFRKRIAGSNYDATIANAFVSGTTYKIAATWGAAGTAIYLDGVAGTPHANTTAAQIAATMQVGADGNRLQQPGAGTTNLRIWQRQLSSPEGVAVTA